jgi:predicted DNA-binding transcriptional regulator AlpA
MTDDNTPRLNMTQFRAALENHGIKMSAGSLSELLSEGEGERQVGHQLGALREGNRLLVPEDAVPILSAFLKQFETTGLKRMHVPDSLFAFLRGGTGSGEGHLVRNPATSAATQDIAAAVVVVLDQLRGEGIIAAQDDRLLDAEQVMTKLALKSTKPVHALRVKVGAANRWRESDINKFIASLK